MKITQKTKDTCFYISLFLTWAAALWVIPHTLGENGILGSFFTTHTFLKFAVVFMVMAHLTITAMSICFHRIHTHHAIKLNTYVDHAMQVWLWLVTSMSKLDWVSVHVYHHTFSDTDKDPHSPVKKGLGRVFFLGVVDYSKAKDWPDVLRIRARIPATRLEKYMSEHLFLGPIMLSCTLLLLFGPLYGSILIVMNITISPLFAVGGVNALAHWFGYQNYDSKDNSRNLGFLFLLNWIICGELDHNNHHRFPKSPTFAHRWFEFDIGWVYVRMLQAVGLAQVTGTIPDYEQHSIRHEKKAFASAAISR